MTKHESRDWQRLISHERPEWKSEGDLQMLNEIINGCGVFMVLVMFGIFAAGSCEIVSERAEKRRIEREIRKKYGRTY